MRIFLLPMVMLLSLAPAYAQLSMYTDFQNRTFVWEDGYIRKIEYLPLIKYSVGRHAIGYIDNARNFKIYSNGGSQKINDGFTQQIHASDYLVAYKNTNALNVWEDGKVTRLSAMVGDYKVGDSVILFFDGIQNRYEAYYNGEVYPIEDFLAQTTSENIFAIDTNATSVVVSNTQSIEQGQLPMAKASDNIAAYVNYANQFHIFYHGEILTLEPYLVQSFDVGRNTVAYVDINQQFHVFQNGNSRVLEEFPPERYTVGDNMVAYIANDKSFKIFYNDSLYTIGYFQPDFKVGDYVVGFEDVSGYFKVFYKGNIYTLESYYPAEYTIAYNSVAYVNRANVLRQFCEGDIFDITNANIDRWQLNYDVVQYRFGANLYKFFYKGKTY